MKTGKGLYIATAVFFFVAALFTATLPFVACGVFLLLIPKCEGITKKFFAFFWCGYAASILSLIGTRLQSFALSWSEHYMELIEHGYEDVVLTQFVLSTRIGTVFLGLGAALFFAIACLGCAKGFEKGTNVLLKLWFLPGIFAALTVIVQAVLLETIHCDWGFDIFVLTLYIPLFFLMGRSFCFLFEEEPIEEEVLATERRANRTPVSKPREAIYESVENSRGEAANRISETIVVSEPCEASCTPVENRHNETMVRISDETIEGIKKLKELLDMEIITTEEFEKKKKELLQL